MDLVLGGLVGQEFYWPFRAVGQFERNTGKWKQSA